MTVQEPQTGRGTFHDHTNMSFNHGVWTDNNSQKKGKEIVGGIATTITEATLDCELISSIQQQSQLIDLTQLHHTSERNVVSTGLGEPQQQPHHHQQQHQQQSSAQSSRLISILSNDLSSHIKQQRDEIELLLHSQGENLKRTLAEKRQRHDRALLTSVKESVARMLREKETEVEKVVRRNVELEAKAAQLSMEAQMWQDRARMLENIADSLQLQLQQHDRVVSSCLICEACWTRVASVVLLPCRHFCLCSRCDSVTQACPVCFSQRSLSVDVFLC